jgi:Ca-activated chloride channel family protein
MKQFIVIILFLLFGSASMAQQAKSYIKKGNDLYKQQKYKEAEADYRKSVEKSPDAQKGKNLEGNFNLGDALYKQKKFADAGTQFNQLAGASNNKALTAAAWHNLGNSFLENKKLEESIDAYKKALVNNPKDDETRYNLAYAQEKLKQQQQQNKDNKNQDKKNQDSKSQDNKNQDKKNQDNKNQDNKDQDKKNQDKKDQQQPDKISKEDAERMLDALNNNEKQTQDKLKNKKLKGAKLNITKDW